MSKVTKLHPGNDQDRKLLEETLGEIAVEEDRKLPETEAELEIYERESSGDDDSLSSPFSTLHEALAAANQIENVQFVPKSTGQAEETRNLAARTAGDLDPETLAKMDAAVDSDDVD